jgi:hypothetical protein
MVLVNTVVTVSFGGVAPESATQMEISFVYTAVVTLANVKRFVALVDCMEDGVWVPEDAEQHATPIINEWAPGVKAGDVATVAVDAVLLYEETTALPTTAIAIR